MLTIIAPPPHMQSTGRDSTSTLNSQQSSLGETSGSQYLSTQSFRESSLRSSQQNDPGQSTPSTSLSTPSSQENLGLKPQRVESMPVKVDGLEGSVVLSSSSLSGLGSAQLAHALTHQPTASKRTADGHPKASIPPMSNYDSGYGHSRTSSTASRSSQISEVSTFLATDLFPTLLNTWQLSYQLKTRLSYAMVKVQNGWQDCSIDELETMASQPNSPVSASALSQRSRRSSHSMSFRPGTSGSTLNGSQLHSNGMTKASARPAKQNGLLHSHPSPRSKSHAPQTNFQPPRTYESFWEERSSRHPHPRPPAQGGGQGCWPTLAPPADIVPQDTHGAIRPRRVHAKTQSLGSPFHQSSKSYNLPATPSTPTHHAAMRPPPKRTPSQSAAMEADAVETLLFMSSPENAHPRSAAASIPSTRTQICSPISHISGQHQPHNPRGTFARTDGNGRPTVEFIPPATLRDVTFSKNKTESADIDQILDDVLSSSDDEDLLSDGRCVSMN